MAVMLCATTFALYGNDLRLAAFGKGADLAFGGLSLGCLLLFALELGVGTWVRPGYVLSFPWWLDLLATLSLLLDVPWVWQPVVAAAALAASADPLGGSGEPSAAAVLLGAAHATRAARAARAGMRAGRIIRLARLAQLVRLARVLKLLKFYRALCKYYALPRSRRQASLRPAAAPLVVPERPPASSMAGQALSEQITIQTIGGVLIFIAVFPFLNAGGLHERRAYEAQAATSAVELALAGADAATLAVLRGRLLGFWRLLRLRAPGFALDDAGRIAALRAGVETESVRIYAAGGAAEGYEALFDVSADSALGAVYSLCLTSFIVILLGSAVYVFNQVTPHPSPPAHRAQPSPA